MDCHRSSSFSWRIEAAYLSIASFDRLQLSRNQASLLPRSTPHCSLGEILRQRIARWSSQSVFVLLHIYARKSCNSSWIGLHRYGNMEAMTWRRRTVLVSHSIYWTGSMLRNSSPTVRTRFHPTLVTVRMLAGNLILVPNVPQLASFDCCGHASRH